MRYVQVRRGHDGNTLDPGDYLEALADLAEHLPPGARTFANEPGHYDFSSMRCVKDLKPVALTVGTDTAGAWAELRLGHNSDSGART